MKSLAQAEFYSIGMIRKRLVNSGIAEARFERTVLSAALAETLPRVAYYAWAGAWPSSDCSYVYPGYPDPSYAQQMLQRAAATLTPSATVLGHGFSPLADLRQMAISMDMRQYPGYGLLNFAGEIRYGKSAYVDGKWQTPSDLTLLGTFNMTVDGSGLFTGSSGQARSRLTMREYDISGKSVKELREIYSALTSVSGGVVDGPLNGHDPATLVFPPSSRLVYMGSFLLDDLYTFFPYEVAYGSEARGYSTIERRTFTSLESMMVYAITPTSPPTSAGDERIIETDLGQMTFDSTGESGGVTFSRPPGLPNKGCYEIRTVAGQRILVLTQVPLPGVLPGCSNRLSIDTQMTFSVMDGAVHRGTLKPANYATTPDFPVHSTPQ
jgi:hypothetical protein